MAIGSAFANYAAAHNRSSDNLSVLGFENGSHG